MKFLEKPIIKLTPPEMPEIRERIEYVRCVTGHTLPSFSIKLGVRTERMKEIILGKRKPTLTILDAIRAIFPIINPQWLMANVGQSGLTEKTVQAYIHSTEVKDPIDQELCGRIRELRETLGMTQIIFASHLKTTRDVIAWVENGRGNPSVILLQRIVNKFQVEDKWLLRGAGPMYFSTTKTLASQQRMSV